MDRIYKYNPNVSYEPNGGRYLQLISAKDLYIQNITVAGHDSHSDSFQVKFPNVFTNYPFGAVRVEDRRFKDCSGNLRQGSRIHCLKKCCFLKDVNNSAYCSEIWPTN